MNLQMIRAERLVNARQRGMLTADFVAALSDADRKAAFVEWLRRRSGLARLAAEDSALLSAMVGDADLLPLIAPHAVGIKAARDIIFASAAASAAVAAHSGAMSVVAGSAAAMVDALSSGTALAAMLAVPAAKDALLSSTALAKASVPKMTSNTTPSGAASAKTIYDAQYAAWRAFDDDDETYWNSAGASSGEWIQYRFPSDVFVHSMTVTPYGGGFSPKNCVLKKSVDGVTFSDAKAMTLPEDGIASIDVASAGFCKYWRLSISSDYGAGYAALKELNFTGFVKP